MSIYDTLNEQQKEAVLHTEGPLLILAGAGSGKTRVLTHRIAYLIEEQGVNPWNILAITFTNKAAGEMRERVDKLVGFGAESIWVSTFHSTCVRILRRHIDLLGYDNNFTIYDSDDQKTLMKDVCKLLQIDTKIFKERALLGTISHAKDELITPEEFRIRAEGDFSQKKIAEVYEEYEKQLRANNALDFDDLLVKTVQLFQTQADVLEYYQERFRYIMVDEYQDTNTVQFELIRLLASKYRNLCVVGDDDQSIYKFRGANIKNILNFEHVFEDAKVIKLEQNYRSTSNILNAANAVIRNNRGRKDKTLWTDNGDGEKLEFRQFDTAYDEAEYIVGDIREHVDRGECTYNDNAILYRTNAQSRIFEEKFVTANIPYKIVGGVNFYARREIKDLLSYLKTVDNGQDDLAVRRIINVPKRGIGLTSINRVQEYAVRHEVGFYEALRAVDLIPNIGRGASKLESFVALIEHFKTDAQEMSISGLMKEIIEETGYVESLEAEDSEEAEARIENIDELMSKIVAYEDACEEMNEPPTLSGFLEEVALVADIDSLDENSDYVVLMTLHSAKGLEFPHVYLAGLEDGIFPSYMTITADDPEEVEEERRLCYVGITRAEKALTLTCARRRMIRGETQYNKMSRFLKEIPMELLSTGAVFEKEKEEPAKQAAYMQARQAFRTKAFAAPKPARQFGTPAGDGPGYGVGDRVRHMKFGEGTVTAIVEGGRDYEVTVDFDGPGTKKMFATFARLQKV
ncbi:MAG: DNA helicase PcrA [[Clostridium] scindens]|uniref:DNA helicase PcrA n=1 Tax=Clostridium scindens (strain JCM 10418 / VPI 12708) TaxID=29347 RepID=UPI000471E1FE|nr:DNA helicase PcrA [[Clostridium] scindens]MCQ4687884.1 DNA helicase PcrA [Clostridium sp. SL.3.18]MCB6287277.1 DNA helicase PcrA [[Clostridium] scindens]MCB6421970.1 DNA helicase PcrA [[Clostridium] scindens]MCB6643986.1 DNA helicase PcrA [[Clostridium] scindens]MCB7193698.1 DNA helicase PcrA [[Clostridium] scindens]